MTRTLLRAAKVRPAQALSGMIWIPGGDFRMGSERRYPEEAPVREARVAGFWMDARHVTNRCAASAEQSSADPAARHIPRKVLKGGSHFCAPSYCRGRRPAAPHAQHTDTSASHVGFRCVVRPVAAT